MKLPAVALALAFSGGILLGLETQLGQAPWPRALLAASLFLLVLLLFAGILLALRHHLRSAAALSLLSWLALGLVAAHLSQLPLPADHILTRLRNSELFLNSPLRWHARLRAEPAALPWGLSFDADLTAVEFEGALLPLRGGMRLAYSPREGAAPLPDLHAGDAVQLTTLARLPAIYRDPGAFDRREFLARQNIHLLATLRAPELLERTSISSPSFSNLLSRARSRLRSELDRDFPSSPQTSGILRAMLLGDRTFLDRSESLDFQKTGVFHVLVVAGLHVGALAAFLVWATRALRLSRTLSILLTLLLLAAYVSVVEQRPPVLRAGLMAAFVLMALFLFRRMDLRNSAALAALLLLIADPTLLLDPSFQFSFLSIGCIAWIASPWLQRHIQPYVAALRNWRDVTRDATFDRWRAQFRLDLRDAARLLDSHLRPSCARPAASAAILSLRFSFRAFELLVLSFILQLGMLPLMAQFFHRVTLAGPLANLVVVPLTGLIVPLGFASLASGLASHALGHFLAVPLGWLVTLQGQLVSAFARLPFMSYRIPAPPRWLVALFFASLLYLAFHLALRARRSRTLLFASLLILTLASVLIAMHPFPPQFAPHQLEVTVLDVGQGDSILVVSPRGSTLLIDGGGAFTGFPGREERLGSDPGEDAVSPYLWSRGFQHLDAVALTHAHQDHAAGLVAVLENFRVSRLFLGPDNTAPALARLKSAAASRATRIEHQQHAAPFDWDGVTVEFLWPDSSASELPAAAPKNNDSLVVRLSYRGRSFLLPGDLEKQAETQVLAENDPAHLHVDVLKVGHHGSKNSTLPDFLAAVSPQLAIISSGAGNPYGHPNPALLQRLDAARVRVLRTDRDGAIQVRTDGTSLNVSCFVECPESGALAQRTQPADRRQHAE